MEHLKGISHYDYKLMLAKVSHFCWYNREAFIEMQNFITKWQKENEVIAVFQETIISTHEFNEVDALQKENKALIELINELKAELASPKVKNILNQ
jgi:hypothetical protein